MAGCCDGLQDLLTSVNDPDKHIRIVYVGRLDVLCRSSGCYVCECRVPLLEGVQIGEACHIYYWGIRMTLIRIGMRATCHQGEGSLHLSFSSVFPFSVFFSLLPA